MSVYLYLFHGRKTPDCEMNDWGFEGPVIGPLQYVHMTYASDMKFEFTDEETSTQKCAELGLDPGYPCIEIHDGLAVLGGEYYGDWEIGEWEEMQQRMRRVSDIAMEETA